MFSCSRQPQYSSRPPQTQSAEKCSESPDCPGLFAKRAGRTSDAGASTATEPRRPGGEGQQNTKKDSERSYFPRKSNSRKGLRPGPTCVFHQGDLHPIRSYAGSAFSGLGLRRGQGIGFLAFLLCLSAFRPKFFRFPRLVGRRLRRLYFPVFEDHSLAAADCNGTLCQHICPRSGAESAPLGA